MSEWGRKIVKNQTSSHAKFHKMPADVFKSDRRSTARRFSLHSHLRLRKSENPHKLEAKSKGNNPNILIIYQNTCQLILSKTYVCDKLRDRASLRCSAWMEVGLYIVRTQLQRWTRNFWTNKKSVSRPPPLSDYMWVSTNTSCTGTDRLYQSHHHDPELK